MQVTSKPEPATPSRRQTYKEEYGAGEGGWHIETGKPPKPLGAWWLRFTWSRSRVHGERANIQLMRAE
jgi:hypothetical protein